MLSIMSRKGRGKEGGWIQLLVLRVIFEHPIHGYALNKKVNKLLAGRRPLGQGSIYTILRRMEGAGLLDSKWDDDPSRLNRRVYHLTESGVERLKEGYHRVENQKRIMEEMSSFYEAFFPELLTSDKD
jgi:DNA-binding PadR family transcriptional regulator